jgi:hypothetical protein
MADRERPPPNADEGTTLRGWLDYLRGTLAVKCDGLSAEQLTARAVPGSSLSLLGLVRHLTNMEVTRLHWFAADDADIPYRGEDDIEAASPGHAETDVAAWRAAFARGDEIIDGASSLDDVGAKGLTVRFVMFSLLYEYGRHMGHADLLREAIDGATGE